MRSTEFAGIGYPSIASSDRGLRDNIQVGGYSRQVALLSGAHTLGLGEIMAKNADAPSAKETRLAVGARCPTRRNSSTTGGWLRRRRRYSVRPSDLRCHASHGKRVVEPHCITNNLRWKATEIADDCPLT